MKKTRIAAFFAALALAAGLFATGVCAASYSFENNKAHVGSLLGSDAPAMDGKALWLISHTSSLNNDPSIDYHCSRRTKLFDIDGGPIPAGSYTISLWIYDESDIFTSKECYTSVFLTLHEASMDDETLFYSHDDPAMTPVKTTIYSQKGDTFKATGKTKDVDGNVWKEYTKDITTDKALARGAVWIYSDGADQKYVLHIDNMTITEKTVAKPAATTAAAAATAAKTADASACVIALAVCSLTTAAAIAKKRSK